MNPENDAGLTQEMEAMLRQRPKRRTPDDFAERTWQRFQARRRARRRRRFLAAACLLLAACAGLFWYSISQPINPVVRLSELERRHRELERELESFRRQAIAARPVIYLGGDETLDLVITLPVAGLTESGSAKPRHALQSQTDPLPR